MHFEMRLRWIQLTTANVIMRFMHGFHMSDNIRSTLRLESTTIKCTNKTIHIILTHIRNELIWRGSSFPFSFHFEI
uniref:Uncharacterized protein n=1 Tax=Lepeophtheirus salmonis TaxID=72036 RepID=A0A0K2UCS7_LEPSM